jgi:hypothetical protein
MSSCDVPTSEGMSRVPMAAPISLCPTPSTKGEARPCIPSTPSKRIANTPTVAHRGVTEETVDALPSRHGAFTLDQPPSRELADTWKAPSSWPLR